MSFTMSNFFRAVISDRREIEGLEKLKTICHAFECHNDNYKLKDSSGDVIGKLHSLGYHYYNYLNHEKRHIKRAKEYIDHWEIGEAIEYEPVELIAEFEAFLFQIKAGLDIFSKSVGGYFGQNPSNINKLKKVLSQSNDKIAKKILLILNKNKWLKDFESDGSYKSMRDIVTHYSSIKTSGILVDNRCENFCTGMPKRKQVVKLKYKRKSVSKLMNEYLSQCFNLIREIYEILYNDIMAE